MRLGAITGAILLVGGLSGCGEKGGELSRPARPPGFNGSSGAVAGCLVAMVPVARGHVHQAELRLRLHLTDPWRAGVPGLNSLATRAYDETTYFSNRVHFLHVYVLEAHPMTPDPSPYSGAFWEVEGLSTIPQARTFELRREYAEMTRELLAPGQIQVIDDLDRDGLINPVWCTYGPAPNSTFIIGQDGVIRFAESWTDSENVEAALLELLQGDAKPY